MRPVRGLAPRARLRKPENHRRQVPVEDSWFDRLPLRGRSVGRYLEDDCRHAVAHIRRFPGIKNLDLDDWDEQLRFAISVECAEALAHAFIRHHLGMPESLTLVRPRAGGFPSFVEKAALATGRFEIAYPHRPLRLKIKPIRLPRRSRKYF